MARRHRAHLRSAPASGRPGQTPRAVAVARLRARLLREGFPRLQMGLIVALTGGAGLLASWMLHAPLPVMALRYPAAVVAAYGVFFLLLWAWLRSGADWSQVNIDIGGGSGVSAERGVLAWLWGGKGGTGQHGDGAARALDAFSHFVSWPLVLLLLLLAALLGAFALLGGIVWGAPVLFAEMLFDSVLAAGLYRHLRQDGVPHWTRSALRRTAGPFIAVAGLSAALGAGVAWLRPGATTLGQAFGG
jgi:hypothetical protein